MSGPRSSTSPRASSPTPPSTGSSSPTIDDVLRGGRFDVISVGFVLALWSGSRAMHVFVDTITIMHGLGGHRGILKTRALSFSLYLLAIVTGIVALPLVVAGPRLVHEALPDRLDFLVSFYWPTVLVLSSASSPRSTTCRSRSGRSGASTCRARRSPSRSGCSAASCSASS